MIGASLPAAMAFAALALALGFVPRRRALWAIMIACGLAFAMSRMAVPGAWAAAVFLGCWVAVGAVGALVYLPRQPSHPVTIAAAAVIGVAAGLVVAAAGAPGDLIRALPAVAIVVPASIAVARGYRIVPRVVASWLIAVALLAAIIPHAVTNPGYVPDHMG